VKLDRITKRKKKKKNLITFLKVYKLIIFNSLILFLGSFLSIKGLKSLKKKTFFLNPNPSYPTRLFLNYVS